jgi:hypothetical protein
MKEPQVGSFLLKQTQRLIYNNKQLKMTIDIWIRFEDLEPLVKLTNIGLWSKSDNLAIKYSTIPVDDSQYCVSMLYDTFVRLTDLELLIKL